MKRPAANTQEASTLPAKKKVKSVKPVKPFTIPKGIDVPFAVKSMLEDMLPFALGPTKHAYQQACIDNINTLLETEQGRLKTRIEEAQAALSSTDDESTPLAKAVSDAEEKFKVVSEEEKAQKRKLGETALQFQAAKKEIESVKQASETLDQQLQKVQSKVKTLQAATTQLIEPLVQGCLDESSKTAAIKELRQLLEEYNMDQSMMQALPSAMNTEPTQRGPFDSMVIAQLNGEMAKAVEQGQALVDSAQKEQDNMASSVSKAEAVLQEKKDLQASAVSVYLAAQKTMLAHEATLTDAKAAKSSFDSAVKRRHRAVDDAHHKLEKFEEIISNFSKIISCPKDEEKVAPQEDAAPPGLVCTGEAFPLGENAAPMEAAVTDEKPTSAVCPEVPEEKPTSEVCPEVTEEKPTSAVCPEVPEEKPTSEVCPEVKCRSCGNTGKDMFGNPCACPLGKM